ncbi:unnamed protein product [Arctogadus glacialis]
MPTAGGAKGRAEKEFMAVCELSLQYCPPPWGRGLRRYGRRWRRAGGFRRANVGGEGWFDLIRSRPVRLLSTSPSLVPAIPAVQWPCRLKRAGPLTSDPHQGKVASA